MAYRGECNFCRVHLSKVQPSISPMFSTLLFHAKPSTALLRPVIRSVTSCYKLRSDLIQFCAATKYILRVVLVLLEGKLPMSRHAWNISVYEKARKFFAGSPQPFAHEFIHSPEECGEFRVGEER